MDVWSTHDWYIDLGELVGQANITSGGVEGRRGREEVYGYIGNWIG